MKKLPVFRAACLLLGLALALSAAGLAEADDPAVVRVEDITYPLSQVQQALNADLDLYSLSGDARATDEERRAQAESTTLRFVNTALIELKLREAGRDGFTAEEEETLRASARTKYEELWQTVYSRLAEAGQPADEAQVTRWMDAQGYTMDAIYDEYAASERRYRAVELFCPEIALTEDMVREYYETQFLNPDRERYENDIEAYESEILAAGNESFYTPEGYRYIRQILLDYPEEVGVQMAAETARMDRAAQALAAAYQALAAAATTAGGWDEMAGPRAEYDAALEEATAARADYDARREALALPLLRDKLDEIRARIDAGEDFLSLIREYSADTSETNVAEGGYPFHRYSKGWPEAFSAAASALEEPGDVSDPVFTDLGVHILLYAGDIPAGEHALTDEETETLNAAALYYYQTLELEKRMAAWQTEYDIETHPEWLVY